MLRNTKPKHTSILRKTLSFWHLVTRHLTVLPIEWLIFLKKIFMLLTAKARLYKLVIQNLSLIFKLWERILNNVQTFADYN